MRRISLTPVGAFLLSPGPFGTYDMGGDVWQWAEANIVEECTALRGGFYYLDSGELASSVRGYEIPGWVKPRRRRWIPRGKCPRALHHRAARLPLPPACWAMLGDGGQAAEPIKTDSPDSILAMFGRRDVSNVDLSARTSRIESWLA